MAANHEPTVTYEGDNNVLVQQTSNWILRQWTNLQNGTTTESPLASVQFLLKGSDILKNKFRPNGKKDLMSLDCKYLKRNLIWIAIYYNFLNLQSLGMLMNG